MNLVSVLRRIGDVAQPRRVGTDAMSPLFAQLLPLAFPSAEVVDGGRALQAARRVKTDEEVAAIRASITVAEAGLAAAVAELRPGVSERELTGVFMDAMAGQGVTTPANQDVVRITTPRPRNGSQVVQPGDLVAFDAGVVAYGYTGEVGRTWPAGPKGEASRATNLFRRWNELWARLAEACQPGMAGSALFAAYEAAGESLPNTPIAHGLGLGFDEPLVIRDLPVTAAEERFEAGAVMVVTGYVSDAEAGAVIGKEAVLITPTGPEVLTSSPVWNA
jgi:Xaa-Pro aminopeptidase